MFPTIARNNKTATTLLIIPSLTSWKAPQAAIKIVEGRLMAKPMIWIHFLFMVYTLLAPIELSIISASFL